MSLKKFSIIQIGLLIIGIFLAYFYAKHQILTADQLQMIYKGYMAAYKDNWINYGNVASTVGNVPGSMLTYVVAIPILLFDSPMSPMVLLIFLHLLSYFLLDSILKDIYKTNIRLIFLVLYWLNPWFLFENILYNPSYLFFFSALHIWSAYKQRQENSFIYSALHIISIGFALQFHYSWIILAVISTYLVYKKLIQINWYGIAFGFFIIIISLMPYFLTLVHNSNIAHHSEDTGRYIGWGGVHIYPVLKSFLYWLRYGSFFFPNKLIASAHFEWLHLSHTFQIVLEYLYKSIVFSIGAFTIYISFKANKYFYIIIKDKLFTRDNLTISKEEWLLLYIFGAVLAVFISSILSPIIFSYWHLIIVFPFAILPTVIYINKYAQKYMPKLLIGITIYFIFINILGAIDSRKYSINTNYIKDTKIYVKKTIKD